MKSAYERAMERLEQEQGPTRKLSDEQKAAIAELEQRHQAKAAETKLGFEQRIATAESYEQFNQLRTEMADELRRLAEKLEADKAAVWDAG